jgi:hypothetical protein
MPLRFNCSRPDMRHSASSAPAGPELPGSPVHRWPIGSDDGPIFSTLAKLVDALERAIPEGTQNAERKIEALVLARELLRGTKYEDAMRMRRLKPILLYRSVH